MFAAIILLLLAATLAAKPICHICKCGYLTCDNLCYHSHSLKHKDYACRMACHCNNVVKQHASCVKAPQKRLASNGNSPELSKLYVEYDFEYFDAQLPLVAVQVTDAKEEWIGQTTQCGTRCFQIVISNPWTPAPIEKDETLLHEMCHVYDTMNDLEELDTHGPHFQSCMQHLARQNAFAGIW